MRRITSLVLGVVAALAVCPVGTGAASASKLVLEHKGGGALSKGTSIEGLQFIDLSFTAGGRHIACEAGENILEGEIAANASPKTRLTINHPEMETPPSCPGSLVPYVTVVNTTWRLEVTPAGTATETAGSGGPVKLEIQGLVTYEGKEPLCPYETPALTGTNSATGKLEPLTFGVGGTLSVRPGHAKCPKTVTISFLPANVELAPELGHVFERVVE